MRFKPRDIVVCVNKGEYKYITVGKQYVAIKYSYSQEDRQPWILIKCDNGSIFRYPEKNFIRDKTICYDI